jgi:Xaa-Pro aminopeptidase
VSGAAEASRSLRLAASLREEGLDALLVSDPFNLRYLTGFTGSSGAALVAADDAGPHLFITDFRYSTQSASQVPDLYERRIVPSDLLEAVASAPADGRRVGFEEDVLTVKHFNRLGELSDGRWELLPCSGLVSGLRLVKESEEIVAIRAASELADSALLAVLEGGLVGRTERKVALELEFRMRRLGARSASFPPIVASGSHSALPHAEPRDVEIPPDTLVTIDWGALLDGYCSDCTRTFATSERLPEGAREVYDVVLAAQRAGLAALRAGPNGRDLDAVARDLIAAAGFGEHFGHGLGHGVGLEIHEPPRLSKTAGEEPLRAGSVVTVEPGIYLPGRFGVRIEDLAVVLEDGCEVFSGLGKELTVVS